MTKSFSIEELLLLNPHIDREEFKKIAELISNVKMRQSSISKLNKTPTSRHRRILIGETNDIDPRTVRLGRKVQR